MLETAIVAARLAGQRAMEEINYVKTSVKNSTELVTEADRRCQEIIVDRIKEDYPDHGLIAEEGEEGKIFKQVPRGKEALWWVIDPIDGTNNYAHRMLFFTVSIGVTEYMPNEDVKAFVNRSDKAMYHSKVDGRNRVSVLMPPPAEEGSPPPAVISASYQSPDLAQSAALVTDQLGPSFADSSQAQVVLPVAAAPQPGRQLHLGFQPVHRVQTAAKAKTVRRAPPAPVIATPVGRDALSSDTTIPAVVADAPETAPPAPPVPRTPVVAAALEDDTDSGAVSGWTAPDSVEEVDVASSASAADSEEALAAPKSPKAKTPTDSYRLQLASLRDRSSASNEGVRLKSRFGELLGDKDLVLESADLGSRGVFHRVQLGPFGSRDHASLTCSDLKALGQDCLVVVR